jgi:hypothetical protein
MSPEGDIIKEFQQPPILNFVKNLSPRNCEMHQKGLQRTPFLYFLDYCPLCKKVHFSANQPAKRCIYHQDKEPTLFQTRIFQ